jgi:ribosomal protein L6P/L9E
MEAKLFCFLEIIGVGYKASTNPQGSILYLKLGFSHEIRLQRGNQHQIMTSQEDNWVVVWLGIVV